MNFSIIQKSQLEGAHRIDAEYYQPEYLLAKSLLTSKSANVLGDYAFVTDGEHGSVDFVEDGIKYLTAENINEGFINVENIRYVSEEVDKRNKRASLKMHDVTLSIKGTVGLAALVFGDELPANMNRDVARIHINEEIDPFFLTVFLNSRFGRNQTLRESSGNVQQMITLSRIRQLLVPKIDIKKSENIKDLYTNSYQQLKNSKKYYGEAEELLLKELGLNNFQVEYDLSFVVNFSDISSANRMDAEYFQPKYEKLIAKIKSQNAKTLGELISMRKGFEPGSEAYQEDGKLFIRVSSVSKLGIEEKDQKYLSDELYQKLKKDYEPKLGDILLTKDATPGIAYVIKEPLEGIISGGILDLKVKDNVECEYLALCISSIVGQWQAQRDAGGSIISHWKPEQVRNLVIPILPTEIQKQIADLVRKSHEARKKSKELLEQAKRKVEEMIEKGAK